MQMKLHIAQYLVLTWAKNHTKLEKCKCVEEKNTEQLSFSSTGPWYYDKILKAKVDLEAVWDTLELSEHSSIPIRSFLWLFFCVTDIR